MDRSANRRIFGVTAMIAFAALAFGVFFQTAKRQPFSDINPFAEDPYDAVGSFAVQGAALIGLLSFGRAVRWRSDSTQAPKARLILRGNALVLCAISAALLADAVAMFLHPLVYSPWADLLRAGLAAMSALTLVCILALVVVLSNTPTAAAPRDLTPADGIDDVWSLVCLPVLRARRFLPAGFVRSVARFSSDWLFARIPWLNPRAHPWRFAAALGVLVGAGLVLVQLQEGLPPSLEAGLLVIGIFFLGELAATLLGFAIFGGYLGLRPTAWNPLPREG